VLDRLVDLRAFVVNRMRRFNLAPKLAGKNAEEAAGTIMAIFRGLDPRRSTTSGGDTTYARQKGTQSCDDSACHRERAAPFRCR
jgi:hypothetical protein